MKVKVQKCALQIHRCFPFLIVALNRALFVLRIAIIPFDPYH